MTSRNSPGSRTRRSRPRTVSISLSDRGQTTQDFAVGIGVFILAVAFVFSYVPSLVTPYDSSVGGAETAQADRIADRIVENTTDSSTPNELNGSLYQERFADVPENLTAVLGLRASDDDDVFDRVNITIESLGDEPVDDEWSGGHTYDDQSAASSARIVTVDDGLDCDPACRLVVRVW
ncbi:hypothetical protein ACFO5R_17415 [Halosolutus amylolyticus]|uniref:Pilin/flagellin n=1 Tax=Halosolutus amylolyticus TaxID=2932267 RepID=A0ABD5PTA6_9EURY|nr:hypothetical protein [Halosolutus amylolyticus]